MRLSGRDGADGRDGLDGPPGARGLPGIPGNKGDTGDIGLPSPTGSSGLTGSPGATGLPGEPGPPGSKGSPASVSGSVYTRWGRTSCPGDASLIYRGENSALPKQLFCMWIHRYLKLAISDHFRIPSVVASRNEYNCGISHILDD